MTRIITLNHPGSSAFNRSSHSKAGGVAERTSPEGLRTTIAGGPAASRSEISERTARRVAAAMAGATAAR
jgi:hypothetical protein